MAGWSVGLCVLGFSFFSFLTLCFGLKHFQMLGGILIKGSLCLPSGVASRSPAGEPLHLCICWIPTAPFSLSLRSWVAVHTSLYFANFSKLVLLE